MWLLRYSSGRVCLQRMLMLTTLLMLPKSEDVI